MEIAREEWQFLDSDWIGKSWQKLVSQYLIKFQEVSIETTVHYLESKIDAAYEKKNGNSQNSCQQAYIEINQ